MSELQYLFDNNRIWAAEQHRRDPHLFERGAVGQAPTFLWIGCCDSRVPVPDIVGLPPGEVFAHRNIANLISPDDLSCMTVLRYALGVLPIRHIIVAGHYGCAGVQAALLRQSLGEVDQWLGPLHDLYRRFQAEVDALPTEDERWKYLCDLNVIEQVSALVRLPLVRDLWASGRPLSVHGWIYDVGSGLLRDLDVTHTGLSPADAALAREAV